VLLCDDSRIVHPLVRSGFQQKRKRELNEVAERFAANNQNNVLVKRGRELHDPDRMYLNPTQILFVEPVDPNSRVAQLIA